jgi:hypothetical protein
MTIALEKFSKTAAEVLNCAARFIGKLNGDLLTGTPTVVSNPAGPHISNVAITVAQVFDGDVLFCDIGEGVQFTVSGGTAGTTYSLRCESATVGGQILDIDCPLSVSA